MSSRSLNKVMLIGNLTRDPELRYTPNGTAVVTFGLATNRSWMPEGATERREETEFHRIVAWSKLADLCAQLLYKGVKVFVEGRLQTRTWNAQDGSQKTTTEVVIDDMIVLDKKGDRALHQAAAGDSTGTIGYQPQVSVQAKPVVVSDDKKEEEEKKVEETVNEEPASTKSSGEAKEDLTPEDIPF
jgi:single-strand DNA-binding protein